MAAINKLLYAVVKDELFSSECDIELILKLILTKHGCVVLLDARDIKQEITIWFGWASWDCAVCSMVGPKLRALMLHNIMFNCTLPNLIAVSLYHGTISSNVSIFASDVEVRLVVACAQRYNHPSPLNYISSC